MGSPKADKESKIIFIRIKIKLDLPQFETVVIIDSNLKKY